MNFIVEGRRFSNERWARVFASHLAADQERPIRIDYDDGTKRDRLEFDIVEPDGRRALQYDPATRVLN